MKLIKIDSEARKAIMEANEESGNVHLVPCCYDGMDGEYVEYDAVQNEPGLFVEQIKALGIVLAENIVEVEEFLQDGMPTSTLREVAAVPRAAF